MNVLMKRQTKRLIIRLLVAAVLYTLSATACMGIWNNYKSLELKLSQQNRIRSNLAAMKTATGELQDAAARIRRMLPPEYPGRSDKWYFYSRIDELKSSFSGAELVVQKVEKKDGIQRMGFTVEVPMPDQRAFSAIVNGLGALETRAFPFVAVNRISLAASRSPEKPASYSARIDGALLMPERAAAGGAP